MPAADPPSPAAVTASRTQYLLVAGAALLAFLPSLASGFVFDDHTLITDNTYAQSLDYLGRCFQTDLFDTSSRATGADAAHFYRPLVCASYALNWALAGDSAWSYHLLNVVLHVAASVLALRAAVRWLGSPALGTAAALIFAVHPSRAENVTWISGRTDVMMGLFVLLALELCWHAATSKRRAPWWFLTAAGAWVSGVLSKEFAVSLPVLLALEWWLGRVHGYSTSVRRRLFGATVGFGVAAFGYLQLRAQVFPIIPSIVEGMALPLALKTAYVLLTLGYYVERTLFPWPPVFDYKPIVVIDGVPQLSMFSVGVGAVTALALLTLLLVTFRRKPSTFGLLIAGVILFLPISNISYTGFPSTSSDRFLYVPLLVWCTALASLLKGPITRSLAQSRSAPLSLGAMVAACVGVNWVRAVDFVNNEAFWRAEQAVNPDSPRALGALGTELVQRGAFEEGFQLILRAGSPSSLRYRLMADPTTYYVGMLRLHEARIADCNVDALNELSTELLQLARLAPRPGVHQSADITLRSPPDENQLVSLQNLQRHVAVAGITVAARLGQTQRVMELLALLPPDVPASLPDRFNVANSLARVGQYEAAREQLELAAALAGPTTMPAVQQLSTQLTRARAAQLESTTLPPEAADLALAEHLYAFGAYLLASRSAQAAYERAPERAWRPLVTYLTWCRLESQATNVAERHVSAAEAQGLVQKEVESFTQRTHDAIPPSPTDLSWTATLPR